MPFLSYIFSEITEVPDSRGDVADITGDISTSSISASDVILNIVSRGGSVHIGEAKVTKSTTSDELMDMLLRSSHHEMSVFMNSDSIDTDLNNLSHIPGVTFLCLGNSKITDSGIEYLKEMSELKSINLSGTAITDAGFELLSECQQLESVWVGHTKVSDKGLAFISRWPNLKSLHLGGTNVTDAGLEVLKDSDALQELFLNETHISDAGLKHLQHLTSLEELSLGSNSITDAGLPALCLIKNLKDLGLSDTLITDEGLSQVARLRELSFLNIRGTEAYVAKCCREDPFCSLVLKGTTLPQLRNQVPKLREVKPSKKVVAAGVPRGSREFKEGLSNYLFLDDKLVGVLVQRIADPKAFPDIDAYTELFGTPHQGMSSVPDNFPLEKWPVRAAYWKFETLDLQIQMYYLSTGIKVGRFSSISGMEEWQARRE